MPKSFRDLEAFQLALDLLVDIYEVTAGFPRQELYGLTSQLRRACVGVTSQVAEGQGRITHGEWRQFLSQARGSLFEVESQVIVSQRLAFLNDEAADRLQIRIRRTGKALLGLIRYVKECEAEARKPQPRNRVTPQPG
jgi:four helix bundle protein